MSTKSAVYVQVSPHRSSASHSKTVSVEGFRCILCGSNHCAELILGCRDLYLSKPFVVDYYRCAGCGLVQQHPVPADVGVFYEAYPVHERKSRIYTRFRRALSLGVYLAPRSLAPNSTLLDFGCGDGWYLEWCRESGVRSLGIEADPAHAARLRDLGLPVYSNIDELTGAHASGFDLITLHFVVEHLTDIRGVLSSLRDLLKPGGSIRYVVPNIDSWEFRLFGRSWHGLDPPRHISFPDARHARLLAKDLSMIYGGEKPVSFANGFGGSIPTMLTGRFRLLPFLATLPLSLFVTWLFPSGNRAYLLTLPA